MPTKYRCTVITQEVDTTLKQICEGIKLRYDWMRFLKIGINQDMYIFLIQLALDYSQTKIITTIKSITVKCIYAEHPELKKKLWCGSFWSNGYFLSSAGKNTSEKTIQKYVRNQGKQNSYEQILLRL